MAQAHSFWLIIDGAVPTSFRARVREDLLPTLHQLQRTQPGVRLVWFEGGRSWDSPEAAREARELKRRESRGRKPTWRPGGAHVDPREKYKLTRDEKRARFKKRATFERQRSEGSAAASDRPKRDRPYDHRSSSERLFGKRPFGKRPFKPFKREDQTATGEDRPRKSWKPKGPWKPRTQWKSKGQRGPRGRS